MVQCHRKRVSTGISSDEREPKQWRCCQIETLGSIALEGSLVDSFALTRRLGTEVDHTPRDIDLTENDLREFAGQIGDIGRP